MNKEFKKIANIIVSNFCARCSKDSVLNGSIDDFSGATNVEFCRIFQNAFESNTSRGRWSISNKGEAECSGFNPIETDQRAREAGL